MWLEDCPHLWRRALIATGALGIGVRTRWAWQGIADAPSIEITGGDGAFTIDADVHVVVTRRGMICPRCGCECFYLLYRTQ